MSVENISTANGLTRQVEIGSATATSSDTNTVIATIDARGFTNISVTAKNSGAQSVVVEIVGSNDTSAYSDETSNATVSVGYRAATISAGASQVAFSGIGGNVTSQAPAVFATYRIKLVNSTLAAGHASPTTVYWCLKNT